MVSVAWAAIAFSLGLLTIVALPAVASALAMDLRLKIGRTFYSWTTTVMGACAIVWRELGNPSLKSINVDDETKFAEVVLSSGTLSDDQKLPFQDPADRLSYLYKKPFAIVPETVPAATDAELAEVAFWTDLKEQTEGLRKPDGVDPHIPMSTKLRAVNPLDVINIAGRGVEPENVKTAERHTRARFAKYGGMVGAKEAGVVFLSFAVGAFSVAGLVYLRAQVIGDGGGAGGQTVPIPSTGAVDIALDAVAGGLI